MSHEPPAGRGAGYLDEALELDKRLNRLRTADGRSRRGPPPDRHGHLALQHGVVGEQPYLKPGEGFQYTSGAVLKTPVGTMSGSYQMVKDDGTSFVATAGTSYVFDSNEVHGIDKVYEPTELVECFSPMRPEYA